MQTPIISIIVIFKNNADRVAHTIAGVSRLLDGLRLYGQAELILIDDSSDDTTFAQLLQAGRLLDRARCRILQSTRGFGEALRIGRALATGSIVCTLDGASTYDPAEMLRLIDVMHLTGCDVVTGSPYHPWTKLMRPRRMLSKAINSVYRLIVSSNIYCYSCFFRAYRRESLAWAALSSDGYVANTELLIDLARKGASIVEYPLTLGKPGYGKTPRQTWEIIRDHLRLLARTLSIRNETEPEPPRKTLAEFAITERIEQR
ncbi:glycosyltransferase family 2 protein [bacterium]|nr:glycosyltransferase family 2 protein [bacterium]